MKRSKKLISLCIAAMLFAGLSGCGKDSSIIEENYLKIDENSIDLKGRTIKVSIPGNAPLEDSSSIGDSYAKHLNDLMLKRQKEAEKKYNCKIEWKPNNVMVQTLSSLKAGTNTDDIIYVSSAFGSLEMAHKGLIEPLDDYIDYSNGVYSDIAQSKTIWNGKHYGIVADYAVLAPYFTYNKDLILSEGLSDPYEMMLTDQWTWDSFLEIAKKTTKDTNGDGEPDVWGIEGTFSQLFENFIFTNGGDYVVQEEGQYKLAFDTEPVKNSMQFVINMYRTDKVVYDSSLQSNLKKNIFSEGSAAFTTGTSTGNEDFEVGKVCLPKGPNAEDYIAYSAAGDMYSIPSNVKDKKSVAAVMSTLFSYYDSEKEDYIKPEEGYRNSIPEGLIKVMKNKPRYSWFVSSKSYTNALLSVYQDIMRKGMSIEEAFELNKGAFTNGIMMLNQPNGQ